MSLSRCLSFYLSQSPTHFSIFTISLLPLFLFPCSFVSLLILYFLSLYASILPVYTSIVYTLPPSNFHWSHDFSFRLSTCLSGVSLSLCVTLSAWLCLSRYRTVCLCLHLPIFVCLFNSACVCLCLRLSISLFAYFCLGSTIFGLFWWHRFEG